MPTQEDSGQRADEEIVRPTDFTRLLSRPAERDEVDYKLSFSKEKEDVANTVKVYAAMANIGGGLVIYGYDLGANDPRGVTQEEVETLDPARLGDFLKKYLSPVPKVSRSIVEYEGKKFAFVTVEPTFTSPVLVTQLVNRDGKPALRPGALYVRENTKSVEAQNEAQARKALDLIIGYQVRSRLAEIAPVLLAPSSKRIDSPPTIEIIARRQAEERSGIAASTPVRELILAPKNHSEIFDIGRLRTIFEQTYRLKGLVVPHYATNSPESYVGVSERGIISGYAELPDGRRVFARIDQDGSLYWCATLLEDNVLARSSAGGDRFKEGVGVMLTLNLITLAVRLSYAHTDALDLKEGMELTYSLRNIKNRKLVVEDDFSRLDFYSARRCFDQNVNVKGDILANTAIEHQLGLAKTMLMELYQQFNWPDPSPSQLETDLQEAFRLSRLERTPLNF